MNIVDFFIAEQKRLHHEFRSIVDHLTLDEWHYALPGTTNHIAFMFMHSVRTEDNVLRYILQGRNPIWNEGNWHERLNLPARFQGTGMATEQAQAIRISDPALFLQYTDQVWQEFEQYLASIQDGGAALSERIVTVKPLGDMPAIQVIGQVCISHLFMHLGEISQVIGAQGKKGWSF